MLSKLLKVGDWGKLQVDWLRPQRAVLADTELCHLFSDLDP
jgi:hypothetical protein